MSARPVVDWRCARCSRLNPDKRFCCRACGWERSHWNATLFRHRPRLREKPEAVKGEQLELPGT